LDCALIGVAVAMFAVTNIDDMVVLAVFFGQAAKSRSAAARVVTGQYLGFGAILAAAVVGARGAELLPESAIPYLGLLPLILGLRAGWQTWRGRGTNDSAEDHDPPREVGVIQVATVTVANGGDNIGVYVPVFAVAGATGITTYVAVFLIGVAVWCFGG
jgi:cadmium resistance protein CadD (predicted permease)